LVTSQELEFFAREPWQGVDRIGLGARVGYRASRVADAAGQIIIPEHLLLGAQLGVRLWRERLGLRAAVENITDAAHFDAIGYPLPGRSWHATGELWW